MDCPRTHTREHHSPSFRVEDSSSCTARDNLPGSKNVATYIGERLCYWQSCHLLMFHFPPQSSTSNASVKQTADAAFSSYQPESCRSDSTFGQMSFLVFHCFVIVRHKQGSCQVLTSFLCNSPLEKDNPSR